MRRATRNVNDVLALFTRAYCLDLLRILGNTFFTKAKTATFTKAPRVEMTLAREHQSEGASTFDFGCLDRWIDEINKCEAFDNHFLVQFGLLIHILL